MALTMLIPDEVIETIRLPRNRIESELLKEMAYTLYQRELVSMGVARRFANLGKWDFIEGLAERGILRHYDENEADEDIIYARNYK